MCDALIYYIWQALKADVFWRRLSVVPRAQGSAFHLKEQNPHCEAAQVPLKLVFVRKFPKHLFKLTRTPILNL